MNDIKGFSWHGFEYVKFGGLFMIKTPFFEYKSAGVIAQASIFGRQFYKKVDQTFSIFGFVFGRFSCRH